MNATIRKFGYPATLIAEHEHWVVLLRPQAVTLGSLVLAAKHDATAFGDLPSEAFVEQAQVVRDIETALRMFVPCEKINYLMLMMVDPHVHYHVIPRYCGSRRFRDTDYADAGWPGMPALGTTLALDSDTIAKMVSALRTQPD